MIQIILLQTYCRLRLGNDNVVLTMMARVSSNWASDINADHNGFFRTAFYHWNHLPLESVNSFKKKYKKVLLDSYSEAYYSV